MKNNTQAPIKEPSHGAGTRRWDAILVIALLLLGACVLLFVLLTRERGAAVVVTIDGEEVARYALSDEGEYTLEDGKNVFVIKDGGVYMSSADCPDHLCVEQGDIHYIGQSITCLPNRVHIYLEGAPEGEVDLESR